MEIDFDLLKRLAAALAPPDEIAKCMGLTKTKITQALKEKTGETLDQYVDKVRWQQLNELRKIEMELAKKSEKMALFLEERLAGAAECSKRAAPTAKGTRIRREYIAPKDAPRDPDNEDVNDGCDGSL